MDFSGWLKPDDVVEKLLVGVFGPTATIVAIFFLANFLWSWFGFAKSSGGLVSYTRWDWISTVYLLTSIGALVASYISAFGYGERDIVGPSTLVLALPLMLPWGLFSLIGSLLVLLLAGLRTLSDDSPKMDESGRIFLTVTLIVLCYTLAVSLALGSTRTIARFWRPSVPDPTW
jgi:hypothetical protein